MKSKIIENIDNPDGLEKLYRTNKQDFKNAFEAIADDYPSNLVTFWKIRLTQDPVTHNRISHKSDWLIVIGLALLTGLLAKIPALFPQISTEIFYFKNLALIVFNGLIMYLFWQNKMLDKKSILTYTAALLVITVFVNVLPYQRSNMLAIIYIHVPLLLWCLWGLAFTNFDYTGLTKRMEFIRFNGEIIIMTGLILIAGGLLTVATLSLFSAIHLDIEKFYTENIAVIGGCAAPIIACFLIRLYPTITSKIAPVIAKVFSPLVLITLVIYLISLAFSGSNILEDREVLLLFTLMLIAVMAIIVFTISEWDKSAINKGNLLVLFLLAVLAIAINTIALIAIISRITDGLTPNRTVVLLSNILIFIHLIILAGKLFRSYFKNYPPDTVEKAVASYLPVYLFYTIFAIFILPLIFGVC